MRISDWSSDVCSSDLHADSDLLGLGVSAISHIGDSFSQNPRDLPSWQIALDQGRLPVCRGMRLEEDDVLRAELIRSEERRVGKECVSTCSSRWSPSH